MLDQKGWTTIGPVQEGCESLLLTELVSTHASVVYVATHNQEIFDLERQLSFFAPALIEQGAVVKIPAWDCLPYDRLSPSAGVVGLRWQALEGLAFKPQEVKIVLLSAEALMQYVPPKSQVEKCSYIFTQGGTYSLSSCASWLVQSGYERVNEVINRGQFSLRGSILDILPSHESTPYRLDFFGDTLESIKSFDLETQKPTHHFEKLKIFAAREIPGDNPPGMEHVLSHFYPHLSDVFDYLPQNATFVFTSRSLTALEEFNAQIHGYYEARMNTIEASSSPLPYSLMPPESLYLSPQDLSSKISARSQSILFSPFKQAEGGGYVFCDSHPVPSFYLEKNKGDVIDRVVAFFKQNLDKKLVVSCRNQRAIERAMHIFQEHGSYMPLQYASLGIEHGFIFRNTLLVTERDIFGDQIVARSTAQKRKVFFDATSLEKDELVVHAVHGIGCFRELVTLEVQAKRHDFLCIAYEGSEKLYLPVENMDLLSRYGGGKENAVLDRLGSSAFRVRKARLKKALQDIANDLIRMAAQRQMKCAPVFRPPLGLWEEFCAAFPYVETEDQERAIQDVVEDLERGQPIDRLICGDVGFGKTEVAMRAAMIVAAAGGQVAVIAPTTILVRQHLLSFRNRFKEMPMCIEQLSRLVSPSQAKTVRQKLKEGLVDIIIGTHTLLSKNIEFKNLALVIVDEEQHFGVVHKEKLKTLCHSVHVLTLTATPIPRTLQMAFSGIKDLSTLTQPPIDRLFTHTYVMPMDSVVITQALMREHHRNGQSFYVVPRVADLPSVAAFIRTHAPALRVATAHGQMTPSALDQVMNDFYDGQYDVLLSTSIIESGIDIPRANTVIVHKAHMFGLSQLYQLRGRVGRSKVQAYCYFTTPDNVKLPQKAEQRLKVLQSLDSLGSGFTLASHDLDMRGAGNIFGQQQSGHMKDVGSEMYQTMLEEAILDIQARETAQPDQLRDQSWSPTIQVDMPVLLPESYVPDVDERMSFYQKLSHASTPQEVQEIEERLQNRFGPLCHEALILMRVTHLRNACKKVNISKIKAGEIGFSFFFMNNDCPKPDKLFEIMAHSKGKVKINARHAVVCSGTWKSDLEQLDAMIAFVESLARAFDIE